MKNISIPIFTQKSQFLGVFLETKEVRYPSVWEQITTVFDSTTGTINALFSRQSAIGLEHMSSIVGIGQVVHQQLISEGILAGISIMILINISLALFNLLPIPILDGGHIVMGLIQVIFGRPLPTKFIRPIISIFYILLLYLMFYITFNDISHINTQIYNF